MKILFLTTHLNIGGITRYVTNLSKALKRRGHTVFVASGGGDSEEVLAKSGIRHISLNIKTKSELSPKLIKSFFALKSFLKEEKIDLMHAHTRVTQVLAFFLSRFFGIPYVTTCHGFFKKRLGRKIFGCWGEKVVAISEAVSAGLIRDFKVGREKIAVVPTGIEVERFSRALGDREKKEFKRRWKLDESFVLGAIGRLSPVKGQETLIRSLPLVLEDFPDTKVLLVGDGPDEKRLKKLSCSLGLSEKIIFTGSLKDTKHALSTMDIFVLPSINEGLGLSLIEAMASGKACIASKVGGIETLIEDGVSGMLIKTKDANELSSAVKYMRSNKEKKEGFEKKAREKALSRFDISKMAEDIEKVCREVTEEKKTGSKKKILIFNVNWLGDIIFTSPFIRAIRGAFPDSYIACAVPPRCREILDSNIRINKVIIFDEKGAEKTFWGKLKFALRLRKKKFDIAFILHRSLTKALITFVAGIGKRIGYDTKKRGFLLGKKLEEPKEPIHKVEYFLNLAKLVGADTSEKDYDFFITEGDKEKAESILKKEGIASDSRIVALNPGGNWDPKRWPTDRFSELADKLIEKYNVKIVITGSEKDKILASDIEKRMKNTPLSICGKTTLREAASIFKRAGLVVSGDSGPMHIAVATGANVVTLFGPTSSEITGPYGKGNYTVIKKEIGCKTPCYDLKCTDNKCMKAITPRDVLRVVEEKGYLKRDF